MKPRGLFFRNINLTRVLSYSCKCVFSSTGKVSVVRKKFTRDSIEVLETKSAASVLRKLNWENQHLFGGIIKDCKRNDEKEKSEWKDKISNFKVPLIQYEINLPVFEEANVTGTSGCSPFYLHTCRGNEGTAETEHFPVHPESILNTILQFPLLNDTIENSFRSSASVLRKHLQSVSSTIPSVTTVLDKTMHPDRAAALERWKLRMIAEMGKERFEAYHQEILSSGSTFHSTVNAFLRGTPESDLIVQTSNAGHWKSIQNVLPNIQNVKLLEERVTHPYLQYGGVVDCIAHYRDQLVVVEWKTSKKPKATLQSTYDNPLQLAAYVGALNFDPRFQYMVDKGLIVIVYEAGTPAHCHFLEKKVLNQYWVEWLKRLKNYWESL